MHHMPKATLCIGAALIAVASLTSEAALARSGFGMSSPNSSPNPGLSSSGLGRPPTGPTYAPAQSSLITFSHR